MWGGRNVFDSAVRLAGGKLVTANTLDELRGAINGRTAMMHTHYPADPDPTDPPPLAEMIRIAKAAGVPIFVDAAGGIPPIENLKRYSALGADLYAFSGGKGLRGPQCSGLLLGRKDLIDAALANSNPVEGAVCRAMKVGKEEIAGCLAAVEKWLTVDLEALYAEQRKKLARIAAMVETVKGVTAVTGIRRGSNRFAELTVRWDPAALGLGAEECARRLREGEPSISVLSNYNPYVIRIEDPTRERKAEPRDDQIVVYALGLQPGEELIVGRRLREVLKGR
jgi:L-seryl-tRNA(Ser) seleniumtransferase